jgi:hypothetical protein
VIGRRRVLLLAVYAGLVLGSLAAGPWLAEWVQVDLGPGNEPQVHRMLLLSTAVYVLALAVPFVPGAEIGLAMMAMLGTGVVPLVYGATVVALSVAYLIGRLVPVRLTAAWLGALGLRRASELMLRLEALKPAQRLELLCESSPRSVLPFLLRHRYLMLGLALNLPGNSLIGGGGGIAMVAGLSGLVTPIGFLLTAAVAVAPVPLLFLILGALP